MSRFKINFSIQFNSPLGTIFKNYEMGREKNVTLKPRFRITDVYKNTTISEYIQLYKHMEFQKKERIK